MKRLKRNLNIRLRIEGSEKKKDIWRLRSGGYQEGNNGFEWEENLENGNDFRDWSVIEH